MVLFLIPAATAGLYTLTTQGGETILEGTLEDAEAKAAELGQTIVEGLPSAGEIGSAVGSAVAAGISAGTTATIAAIEEIGPAVVTSLDRAYDAVRAKIRLNPVDVIASLTFGSLVVISGVYVYSIARKG